MRLLVTLAVAVTGCASAPSHPAVVARRAPDVAAPDVAAPDVAAPSRPASVSAGDPCVDVAAASGSPIDAACVGRVVRGTLPRIRGCYERAGVRLPEPVARVGLRFGVSPSGRVERLHLSGLDEAPAVAACVVEIVEGLRLPKPADVPVEFHLTLHPGGVDAPPR